MASVAISGISAGRRFDVDWLRLAALGLLIVYHVLCVFDGRPFVTKSDFAGPWADGYVNLLTPWRMPLVFLIGGVAARFLLGKLDTFQFVRDRAQRLVLPFVFAVIVIIPPQVYVERLEAHREFGTMWDFWLNRAWTVIHYHGLAMPNFEHAWFLPYLFLYAVMAAFLWRWAPHVVRLAKDYVERNPVWLLVGAAMIWYAILDVLITPIHARSVFVLTDINSHLRYAPPFFLGLLIGRSDLYWTRLIEARRSLGVLALVMMAASLGVLQAYNWAPSFVHTSWITATRSLYGGVMLFAVLAWASAYLNKPSRALAYGTDAILPVYLIHQTLLVLAAYYSGANHWPVALEFSYLMVVSIGGSLLFYHTLIRYNPPLRAVFGLRMKRRRPETIAVEPPPAANDMAPRRRRASGGAA